MKFRYTLILMLSILILAACGQQAETATQPETEQPVEEEAQQAVTLTVMTHDSFAVSEEVLAEFESQNNVSVQFLKAGDAGSMLNKAILAGDEPLADVLYGVDNTFLSRALSEDIFEAYESPVLESIPEHFLTNGGGQVLPVDWGDVCVNYDIGYFEDNELTPPTNLEEMLLPQYKDLLVVENPASSSTGLAFLFATIGHFGPDGYLNYWLALKDNGVLVVNDWETAYYSEFSRWGGARPLVVSYGSSPPVEIVFAEEPMDEPVTGVVTGEGSCFRQIEYVGILKGTKNRDMAEKWVDFMLSPTFQEDMPLQMYVFPVNNQAELPEVFVNFLAMPDLPAELDPDMIAEKRETWIEDWTETILR